MKPGMMPLVLDILTGRAEYTPPLSVHYIFFAKSGTGS